MVSIPDSLTFATDPRVVESVIGSAPVEHPQSWVKRKQHAHLPEQKLVLYGKIFTFQIRNLIMAINALHQVVYLKHRGQFHVFELLLKTYLKLKKDYLWSMGGF